jgi:hypothetical protein
LLELLFLFLSLLSTLIAENMLIPMNEIKKCFLYEQFYFLIVSAFIDLDRTTLGYAIIQSRMFNIVFGSVGLIRSSGPVSIHHLVDYRQCNAVSASFIFFEA